jgi:molybdopterin molybdotransferase
METFFNLKTPQEVFQIIDGFGPLEQEEIPLEKGLGRVISVDIIAPHDLPGFSRSTMDGYAVRAKDTFGANESLPALLETGGEILMGEIPKVILENGQAVRIHTGGMLPEGADGVVMLEYCYLLDKNTLEVQKAISPLENVILPYDDYNEGACVIKNGRRLRCQDIGALAGIGYSKIMVYKRPRVAIISTGDEVIPIHKSPELGQVRDINRYTIEALCEQNGADPIYIGLCPDEFDPLRAMVKNALDTADTVWITGGSSVGTRDITLAVLETLPGFNLLAHGISISPGKPTIIAMAGLKSVIGLPGHVSSAMIVAEIFLTRLISCLSGEKKPSFMSGEQVEAVLGRNIESASGREEYIRMKLVETKESLIAEPILGKSGLISTLVEADGLVCVDMNTEGLYRGQLVKVKLFN